MEKVASDKREVDEKIQLNSEVGSKSTRTEGMRHGRSTHKLTENQA